MQRCMLSKATHHSAHGFVCDEQCNELVPYNSLHICSACTHPCMLIGVASTTHVHACKAITQHGNVASITQYDSINSHCLQLVYSGLAPEGPVFTPCSPAAISRAAGVLPATRGLLQLHCRQLNSHTSDRAPCRPAPPNTSCSGASGGGSKRRHSSRCSSGDSGQESSSSSRRSAGVEPFIACQLKDETVDAAVSGSKGVAVNAAIAIDTLGAAH